LSGACLFCQIVQGQSPAHIEYEDEAVVAFRDIYPKAPIHLLIVPRRHIESVMVMAPEDAPLVGQLVLAAKRIGEAKGLAERGYRLALHCGPEGGQVVYHVHLHFTAGRREERRVERR
jgi:histidine triad (HIT) family protein